MLLQSVPYPTSGGGGGTSGVVALSPETIEGGLAKWMMDSGGYTYITDDTGTNQSVHWINPQNGMGLYEAMATLVSGPQPNVGSYGVWVDLNSSWTWGWGPHTLTKVSAIVVSVRNKTTKVVQSSARINLTVDGSGTM